MGGARLWARLEAADVPTAQTIALLPRQLLLAEGFRTLLVPLLLAAVVAVVTYVSRIDEAASETKRAANGPEEPVEEKPEEGAGDDEVEVAQASAAKRLESAVAHTEQVQTLETALEALADADEDIPDEERRKQLQRLRDALTKVRGELDAAASKFNAAAAEAEKARAAAAKEGRPSDRLDRATEKLHGSAEQLKSEVAELEQAGRPHAGRDRAARRPVAAAKRVLETASDVRSEASSVEHDLRRRPQATPVEGLRTLVTQTVQLAPLRFLFGWFTGLWDRYGPITAVLIVVLLVILFGGIALVIVGDTDWWFVGGTAFVCFAFAAYFAWTHRPNEALIATALLLPAVPLMGIATALDPVWALSAVGVTVLTIWLALGAMDNWRSPAAVAWILFAAIAFWSGALGFFRELGGEDVELDVVLVVQKSAPRDPLVGLYLGKTSSHVYVASEQTCREGDTDCRRVLSIADDDVSCLAFGPPRRVRKEYELGGDVRRIIDEADERDSVCAAFATSVRTKARTPPQPAPSEPSGEEETTPTQPIAILDTDIAFRSGSATLTPIAEQRVKLLPLRRAFIAARRLYIHGHTDNRGTRPYNWRLSHGRARSVRRVLVEGFGVRAPAIAARGFGERRPRACNRRPDGSDATRNQARNRRVEIWVGAPPDYEKPVCD